MDTETLAREGYDSFERRTRDDGSQYVAFKDRVSDNLDNWVHRVTYDAHNDVMPNDWVFDTVRDAFSAIADGEDANLFADQADVYNSDLLNWVRDYAPAAGFIDEAKDEFGEPRDFYHGIQMGQYLARRMIFDIVDNGIADRLSEIEEEEESIEDVS